MTIFKKREWFLKTKRYWITAGLIAAGLLNLITTASTALSAYYTGKQAELAVEAVNRQSRNEAFSEFIKAKEDLCKVTLMPLEKMFGNVEPPAQEGETDSPLYIDYDAIMEGHSEERTREYARRANELNDVLRSKLIQLKIWLPQQSYWDYAHMVANGDSLSYRADYLLSPGQMAEITALRTKVECNQQLEAAIYLYTGIQPEEDVAASYIPAVIIPISKDKSIEEIIKPWEQGNLLQEELERRGVLAWDRQRLEGQRQQQTN
jgi:hypothetical protein